MNQEPVHSGDLSGSFVIFFYSKTYEDFIKQVNNWEVKSGIKALDFYKQTIPSTGYIVSYDIIKKREEEIDGNKQIEEQRECV
jgi:hypothetical protein